MKETIIPYTPNDRQISILRLDRDPYSTPEYRTNRVLAVNNFVNFDIFKHLWELAEREPNRRIEVLEGGCGEGRALEQLKRGVRIDSDIEYRGLGQRIRTTGITLYEKHLEAARKASEETRIDEMIVGPIEQCALARKFEFIYDFCGAAFASADTVITIYGRLLQKEKLAFIRLLTGALGEGEAERLFEQAEFEIVRQGGNIHTVMDFLVRKA